MNKQRVTDKDSCVWRNCLYFCCFDEKKRNIYNRRSQ